MGITSGTRAWAAPGDVAGVGRKPTRRGARPAGTTCRPRRFALMGRAASSGCTASACCAATGRSTARAIMGIARRRSGTRVESTRGAIMGRRPACGFGALRAGDRLGSTRAGRARNSAGAFLE